MLPVHKAAIAVAALAATLLGRPTPDGRDSLGPACLGGARPASCVALADGIERGAVAARFDEEAGLYLALACEQGAVDACRRAEPWAKRYPDYEALETDVGCMLEGNAFACEEVANDLRGGDGGDAARPDAAALALASARTRRAFELHTAGCAKGDARSCLGKSRTLGKGTVEALAAEGKACALGLGTACEQEADPLPADQAVPLLERACDLPPGSPHACLKLARAQEATGAPAPTIAASYRRACERLAVDACAWEARHARP
jgi:hypothetical protein